MNTLVNPTKEQIRQFCKLMEQQLIAAVDRGSTIEIGHKVLTRELFSPEKYGATPVDLLHAGMKFKAQFEERM